MRPRAGRRDGFLFADDPCTMTVAGYHNNFNSLEQIERIFAPPIRNGVDIKTNNALKIDIKRK
jgi:hypothetical protein